MPGSVPARPAAHSSRAGDCGGQRLARRDTPGVDSLFDVPGGDRAGQHERVRGRATGPLAARVRPTALEDFVGQAHLLAEDSGLRAAIEHRQPHSMVL